MVNNSTAHKSYDHSHEPKEKAFEKFDARAMSICVLSAPFFYSVAKPVSSTSPCTRLGTGAVAGNAMFGNHLKVSQQNVVLSEDWVGVNSLTLNGVLKLSACCACRKYSVWRCQCSCSLEIVALVSLTVLENLYEYWLTETVSCIETL